MLHVRGVEGMNFSAIALELVVGYFALMLLTKFLGKTQITQITAFDFISALILGELVGNSLYDGETGIGHILFAIGIWGGLIFFTEKLTQKSRFFRKLFEGSPSIIINKGEIDYKELKKNHLDLNQLQHLLRAKDIFSVRECHYALIETDGSLSVIKKAPYSQVTKQDLDITTNDSKLPISVILDGQIAPTNLEILGKNVAWLLKEIRKQGFQSPKEVLYAEWQEDESLFIQGYNQGSRVTS